MSTGLIVLIVVLGVLVVAGFVALVLLGMRKLDRVHDAKVASLAEQARERGWQYQERADQQVGLLPPFWVRARFERAHRAKQVQHLITGTHAGRPFFAGFFQLTSGNPSCVRGVGIRLPAPVPRIEVTAKRPPRGASGAFADHYEVTGDNERFNAELLQQPLCEWMLRDPVAQRLGFWTAEDWLYVADIYVVSKVESLPRCVDFLCGVFDHLPGLVWGRR